MSITDLIAEQKVYGTNNVVNNPALYSSFLRSIMYKKKHRRIRFKRGYGSAEISEERGVQKIFIRYDDEPETIFELILALLQCFYKNRKVQRSTTEIENEARWLFTYDAKILKEVCSIFYADLYDDISKDIFCAVSETDELDDITTSMVIAARESVERKGKRLEPRHYSLQEIVELQKETFKTIYHAIDEHESPEEEIKRYRTVSYTHLTLPTN